ncbi:MAG: alcohol dehydrogenase family protein [Pseudoprimorskyibacter sp.]|nr:alcohol dehydrogenase family protein [Pseudoprimorskyibacter sp.]
MTRPVMHVSKTMKAVVTTGHGGYDCLDFRDVAVPTPNHDEVLLRVLAAGINNTDINTRLGWYSPDITSATDAILPGTADTQSVKNGGWNEKTPFPLIQGTDCCGQIVALGAGVDETRLGERVLVQPCMRPNGHDDMRSIWMASDFDGAFAQYVVVPACEAFRVDCDWSSAELATLPCAYGTSENMLIRADVKSGDKVLITGASGGVGSATIQLAKRRGAHVTAITSAHKAQALLDLGADRILTRDDNVSAKLGDNSIDVVVDNVAGDTFSMMLTVLRRGGKFVSSGAIAGPVVTLDMRDMYLKDLCLIGCTAWDKPVFPNLIRYVEAGEIHPVLAATFPLSEIVKAQEVFLRKSHVGNIVLIPPGI